jgi:hypothetical protein
MIFWNFYTTWISPRAAHIFLKVISVRRTSCTQGQIYTGFCLRKEILFISFSDENKENSARYDYMVQEKKSHLLVSFWSIDPKSFSLETYKTKQETRRIILETWRQ